LVTYRHERTDSAEKPWHMKTRNGARAAPIVFPFPGTITAL
jgi:hypothetical protein